MRRIILRIVIVASYASALLIHTVFFKFSIEKIKTVYIKIWGPALCTENFSLYTILWMNIQLIVFGLILAVLWSAAAFIVKKYYTAVYLGNSNQEV